MAYPPDGTGVCTVDHTFPADIDTGAIAEVGLCNDPAAGNMFNRKTFPAINKTAGDSCWRSQLRLIPQYGRHSATARREGVLFVRHTE